MGYSAGDVKAALITTLTTLFPSPTLVSYGAPGAYQPDEIVAVGEQRFEVTRPTMGTNRSREEAVETDVTFSVFSSGGDTAQQVATERVYAMALALDEHFRTKPNETLGGACRDAWVTGGDLREAKATPSPAAGSGVSGRVSELTVTVTTVARRA